MIKFNRQGNSFVTAYWFEEGLPCVNLQGKLLRKNSDENLLYLRSSDREITCISVDQNETTSQVKIPVSVLIVEGSSIGDFTGFNRTGLIAVSKDGFVNTYPEISVSMSDQSSVKAMSNNFRETQSLSQYHRADHFTFRLNLAENESCSTVAIFNPSHNFRSQVPEYLAVSTKKAPGSRLSRLFILNGDSNGVRHGKAYVLRTVLNLETYGFSAMKNSMFSAMDFMHNELGEILLFCYQKEADSLCLPVNVEKSLDTLIIEEDVKMAGKGRVVKIDQEIGNGSDKKTWSLDGKGILRVVKKSPINL